MSVREAVVRAMRSGHVIIPSEFPRIQREAIAALDIHQLHSGDYLLRGDDAEALRGARFRSVEEQRQFYIGLLSQARDRVLVQVAQAFRSEVAAQRRIDCGPTTRTLLPHSDVSCFLESEGELSLPPSAPEQRHPETGSAYRSFANGLLSYLNHLLPAHAFFGLSGLPSPYHLAGIQLLDGVYFTEENFRGASLPAETQLSSQLIQAVYRSVFCEAGYDLAVCR